MTEAWYKHRWPWILIAIPACSVILGIVLIVLAIKNPAIVVVDNYYAEGRGINQSLALDHVAEQRNIQASLQISNERIQLLVNADNRALNEDGLMLHVYHVTDNSRDRTFVLAPAFHPAFSGQGIYEPASAEDLRALREIMAADTSWYFELRGADNDWRLRQRVTTPQQEFVF